MTSWLSSCCDSIVFNLGTQREWAIMPAPPGTAASAERPGPDSRWFLAICWLRVDDKRGQYMNVLMMLMAMPQRSVSQMRQPP
jgi:hypothetical protein